MMEDDPPRRARGLVNGFVPPVLDGCDVEELKNYIARLQAEIGRAEAAIARKEAHRGAADAFFRKARE
ncbi:DUF1192 domain-containing protein [Dankookia rubra]|uniref:DUF1192 domain-containing protein n=1 Tax=Dankookia rubra TaxID=1442381 RepID=A0A4R5QH00_9PROT|nr:DUF1192 domain-containing protein [Dankookia rubra]TDH62570.1 DUF1192 domain-containing protein [Dankookia rubra]